MIRIPITCKRCHQQPLVTATLPIALTNGNTGRSKSWFNSAEDRQAFEIELLAAGLQRSPFKFRVWLRITRILGPSQTYWDADSYQRGNLKELIDSLKAVGWFVDDGWKWISEVRFAQDASQRKNGPAVKIEVFETLP